MHSAQGVTSAESLPTSPPCLLSHLDGQPVTYASGLTTPMSFLGAFSSGGGGSPAWFEGQATTSGTSQSSSSRSRSNSISDALHLLLQGITMPGGDQAVPSAVQRAGQTE